MSSFNSASRCVRVHGDFADRRTRLSPYCFPSEPPISALNLLNLLVFFPQMLARYDPARLGWPEKDTSTESEPRYPSQYANARERGGGPPRRSLRPLALPYCMPSFILARMRKLRVLTGMMSTSFGRLVSAFNILVEKSRNSLTSPLTEAYPGGQTASSSAPSFLVATAQCSVRTIRVENGCLHAAVGLRGGGVVHLQWTREGLLDCWIDSHFASLVISSQISQPVELQLRPDSVPLRCMHVCSRFSYNPSISEHNAVVA